MLANEANIPSKLKHGKMLTEFAAQNQTRVFSYLFRGLMFLDTFCYLKLFNRNVPYFFSVTMFAQ